MSKGNGNGQSGDASPTKNTFPSFHITYLPRRTTLGKPLVTKVGEASPLCPPPSKK